MSDCVIDTSAIIAAIADEPERNSILEITIGAVLLAPASVHWEIGNAFSAMLRRRRITLEQARRAIEIYGEIPLRLVQVDLSEALAIASEHNIYAYDAYLIACAKKHRLPLLTLDRELMSVARAAGIDLLEVTG